MVRMDDAGSETKCWLSRDELDELELIAGASDWEREIAVQLMGRCGLRASKVSYPADEDLRWSDDGEIWLFEALGHGVAIGRATATDAKSDSVVSVRLFVGVLLVDPGDDFLCCLAILECIRQLSGSLSDDCAVPKQLLVALDGVLGSKEFETSAQRFQYLSIFVTHVSCSDLDLFLEIVEGAAYSFSHAVIGDSKN